MFGQYQYRWNTSLTAFIARGPKNGRRGLKSGLPLGFGHSLQLSLNKFFDPSITSMRKGDDGEKKTGKKRK